MRPIKTVVNCFVNYEYFFFTANFVFPSKIKLFRLQKHIYLFMKK